MDLWRFWFEVWPLNLFGNFILGIVALTLLFLRPHPHNDTRSFIYRILVFVGIGLSIFHSIRFMPDA